MTGVQVARSHVSVTVMNELLNYRKGLEADRKRLDFG